MESYSVFCVCGEVGARARGGRGVRERERERDREAEQKDLSRLTKINKNTTTQHAPKNVLRSCLPLCLNLPRNLPPVATRFAAHVWKGKRGKEGG